MLNVGFGNMEKLIKNRFEALLRSFDSIQVLGELNIGNTLATEFKVTN